MSTTIIATLSTYGFQSDVPGYRPGTVVWGMGSLMWGDLVAVRKVGKDLYMVQIHHWLYNEWGEQVVDTTETRELHGSQALAWVFEELPSSFWRRR